MEDIWEVFWKNSGCRRACRKVGFTVGAKHTSFIPQRQFLSTAPGPALDSGSGVRWGRGAALGEWAPEEAPAGGSLSFNSTGGWGINMAQFRD